MYASLLSGNEQLIINKRIIKLFGINSAAYWAELMNMIPQIQNSPDFDADTGYFRLDRTKIEEQTSLDPEEQYKCDQLLTKAGVVKEDDMNRDLIKLDVKAMISLITEEDAQVIDEVRFNYKKDRKTQAEAKKAGIAYNLKLAVSDTDEQLNELYALWIDALLEAGKGRYTKQSVVLFKQQLEAYAGQSKQVKMQLLRIAIERCYGTFAWVRSIYEKDMASNRFLFNPTSVGGSDIEVNTEQSF